MEYDFDSSPTLVVPGDWNSQEDKLFWYEGTVYMEQNWELRKEWLRMTVHSSGSRAPTRWIRRNSG